MMNRTQYRRQKTAKILAVLAVAVMIGAGILVMTDSDKSSAANQSITYNANGASVGSDVTITDYAGIKSSEYNPEYWYVYDLATFEEINAGTDLFIYEDGSYRPVNDEDDLTIATANDLYCKVSNKYYVAHETQIIQGSTSNLYKKIGESSYTSAGNDLVELRQKLYHGEGTGHVPAGVYNWVGPSTTVQYSFNEGEFTGSIEVNKVFGGWNTKADGTGIYFLPGDTVPSNVTALYAIWVIPDLFMDKSSHDITSYYAPKPVNTTEAWDDGFFISGTPDNAYQFFGKNADGTQRDANDKYGTIIRINSSACTAVRDDENVHQTLFRFVSKSVPSATYRGYMDDRTKIPTLYLVNSGGDCDHCVLDGDAIIDNLGVYTKEFKGKHGATDKGSIFAAGHALIIGTNVTNPITDKPDAPVYIFQKYLPQIFGGNNASGTTTLLDTKDLPYQDGTATDGTRIGTCVIVHSGGWGNIIGGGLNGDIGAAGAGNNLSTYVVLRGGFVTDALMGGIAGNTNTLCVYGAEKTDNKAIDAYREIEDPETHETCYAHDVTEDGTYIYVLGGMVTGDGWVDTMTDSFDRNCWSEEGGVINGGGNVSKVYGSSHVFVSDNGNVWDVQAGGRGATSHCSCTYLEISGNAIIRHVAAGTITDAGGNRNCTYEVVVKIRDNAKIGSVFGAGYDTYESPSGSTMQKGTITVDIDGDVIIGDVFGGGYRGTIGSTASLIEIDIKIANGTIKGDVYGGGSGGLDKPKHTLAGAQTGNKGGGFTDTTGSSCVYGVITIEMTGGTVEGNVYGGGKSVPVMGSYSISTGATYAQRDNGNVVAKVYGMISVNIAGGTVEGNVYGGGRGIDLNNLGDYSKVPAMKSDGEIVLLDWFSGGEPTYRTAKDGKYDYPSAYEEYASVQAPSYSGVTDPKYTGKVGETVKVVIGGETSPTIHGSVYGGGSVSKTIGNTKVEIISGNITGSVFGGGHGISGKRSTAGHRVVYIRGGSILNSVYGGSSDGDDGPRNSGTPSRSIVVMSDGTVGGSVFGGAFMGGLKGNTEVYLGYACTPQSDVDWGYDIEEIVSGEHLIRINDSVFAGADVKITDGQMIPYDTNKSALVNGGGSVSIAAGHTDIRIYGSIMAAGNSCLTDGDTSITIKDWIDDGVEDSGDDAYITGIHRAGTVKIINSNIRISGKEARITNEATVTTMSLFRINTLTLQKDTILSIEESADDIHRFVSLNADGTSTTTTYPSNKIVFLSGSSVYIRTNASNSDPTSYGNVEGFTIMAVTDQATYGAYILGTIPAGGGFVVMKDGSYVSAGISDFDILPASGDEGRCWFISGIENKSVTAELEYDSSEQSAYSVSMSLNINRLQANSKMRYAGGDYVPSTSGYSVNNSTGFDSTHFGIQVGVEGSGQTRYLYFSDDTYYDPAAVKELNLHKRNDEHSPGSGVYAFHMKFWGMPDNVTLSLGYVTIRVYEYNTITLGSVSVDVIVNQVDIRVDLYVKGAGAPASIDVDMNIAEKVSGPNSGTADVMIPALYVGKTLSIAGVQIGSMNNGTFIPDSPQTWVDTIVAAGVRNSPSNTYGWKSLESESVSLTSGNDAATIGILSGGYPATLRFSISDTECATGTVYAVTCNISGQQDPLVIYLHIIMRELVEVHFYKVDKDGSGNPIRGDEILPYAEVEYGKTLIQSDYPVVDNLVGWYTDLNYVNLYNGQTPVTSALSLYARCSYVVTFDQGGGTSYNVYVMQGESIGKPTTDPTRFGYTFNYWKVNGTRVFVNDAPLTVNSNMTVVADWTGVTINLKYQYGGGTLETRTIEYGSQFGGLARPSIEGQPDKLEYWTAPPSVGSGSVRIRADTIVDNYIVKIVWSSTAGASTGTITLTAVVGQGESITIHYEMDAQHDTPESWSSSEVIWSSTPVVGEGTKTYTFEHALPGLTYLGWHITEWNGYSVGTEVTITVITDEYDNVFTYQIGNGNPVTVDPTVTITNLVVPLLGHWEQINYRLTLNNNIHGIIDKKINGTTAGDSELSQLKYGDVVILHFSTNPADPSYISSWSYVGECSVSGELTSTLTVTIYGDCTITVIETMSRHFSIEISFLDVDVTIPESNRPVVSVLYDDEDDEIVDNYSIEQLVCEGGNGKDYTYGSRSVTTADGKYTVYMKKGDVNYAVGVLDTRSSVAMTAYVIYFVRGNGTDLTGDGVLCDEMNAVYGDPESVNVLIFISGLDVDYSRTRVVQDEDIYNAVIDGNTVTTAHAGDSPVGVAVNLEVNEDVTQIAHRDLPVTVSKRTLLVATYDDGTNSYYCAHMGDIAADFGSGSFEVQEPVSDLLIPVLSYNTILNEGTATYEIDYDAHILYGKKLPIDQVLSSVTVTVTTVEEPQQQGLGAPAHMPLSSIVKMAKDTSSSQVVAVVNPTLGRRP